jgi:uncharacterized membrane protein
VFLLGLAGVGLVILLARRSRTKVEIETLKADLGATRDDLRRVRDEVASMRRRMSLLEIAGAPRPVADPSATEATADADVPSILAREPASAAKIVEDAAPSPEAAAGATPPTEAAPPPETVAVELPPRVDAAPSAPAQPTFAGFGGSPSFGVPPRREDPDGAAPEPPGPSIDWEQWIGVRGAAALGAIVLVVAGIYFFRYSIEHGLITPSMRVALGVAVGLGCILAGELRLHATHPPLAKFLAGAGSAILYLAFWASAAMYHLIPSVAAFALMALVTATCGLLAVRRSSIAIAILGLFGGFATPILLSSGQDRPVELFAYLFVLNAGASFVAKRRFPVLRALALAGTLLYQVAWIATRLDPARLPLAIGILLFFTVFYAWSGRGTDEQEDGKLAKIVRRITLLTPSVFGFYFALRADLAPDLSLLAPMLLVLAAASSFVAYRERVAWIAEASIGTAIGVFVAWALVHPLDESLAWQLVGAACGLALIAHAGPEWKARKDPADRLGALGAMSASAAGLALVAIAGVVEPVAVTPFVVGLAVLATIVVRQALLFARYGLSLFAGFALAVGLVGLHVMCAGTSGSPPEARLLGVLLAFGAAFQVAGLVGPREARRWADGGALVLAFALACHVGLLPTDAPLTLGLAYGAVAVALLLAIIACARTPGGVGLAFTVLVAIAAWEAVRERFVEAAKPIFALELATAAVFVVTPILFRARYRDDGIAWRAAAAAPMAFFPFLLPLYGNVFGKGMLGVLPIGLGALTLVLVVAALRTLPRERPLRRIALAWAAGAALLHLSIAIPLQLRNERNIGCPGA